MAAFPSFPSLCLTFWLCFFVFSSTSAKTCKKKDTCSCEMDDGGIISLQAVDNKDGTPSHDRRQEQFNLVISGLHEKELVSQTEKTLLLCLLSWLPSGGGAKPLYWAFSSQRNPEGGLGAENFTKIKDTVTTSYTFDWNPCTPLKAAGPCKGNNACQHTGSATTDQYPVGNPDTTFSINSGGDVVISYGKVNYKDYDRQLVVTLKCDTTVAKGSFGGGISESGVDKSSTYTGTFTSKCSCPGKCNYSPNYDHSSSSSSGLSIGSILLIVFFPLVVMYFVIGIVVNKYARHKEGSDVIPNRSFWSDLPFLVKDGCVFTCGKLKGCCSALYGKIKGDDSYAKI